jgi:hypothetical protein
LNESLVNMRNIRTSLIVGVLVVELIFGVFLLSHKSRGSGVEPDVATGSAAELAAASPQSGDTHVSAGSVVGAVVGAAPLPGNTAVAATTAKQAESGTAATESGSPAKAAVQVARPTAPTREPAAVHAYVEPKTDPVPQTEIGRDSLHRHGSNPVASALTDALVKESAKLDPALPPPTQSTQPAQSTQSAQLSREDLYRPSPKNNPVAAAMTSQLVKESAKLDPGLPPPN